MEQDTLTKKEVRLQEVDYNTLLRNYIEPYIQCIARKYACYDIVGMEYDDLCQMGRDRLWYDYCYYTTGRDPEGRCKTPPADPVRQDLTVIEFRKMFKYDMTSRCKDLQRKLIFAEKRSVNKILDLDTAMNSLEERQLPDPHAEMDFIEMETRDLLNYVKTLLTPIEGRIVEELVYPSDELIKLVREGEKNNKRVVQNISSYFIAQLLSKPYNEVYVLMDGIRKKVAITLTSLGAEPSLMSRLFPEAKNSDQVQAQLLPVVI
jgi:hypothetical protein